ncbi:YlxR family protein [Eggerthellaceae bacterium zg-997]|nr:YlxR family protein [Eggerthellaceae bacterium zg-997]
MTDPIATRKRVRTCIGCSATSEKRALLRIVRTPAGAVEADPTGRKPGRGAYVCSATCFERALKTARLQRALKTNIDSDQLDGLVSEVIRAFAAAEA